MSTPEPPHEGEPSVPPSKRAPTRHKRGAWLWIAGGVALAVLVGVLVVVVRNRDVDNPQHSSQASSGPAHTSSAPASSTVPAASASAFAVSVNDMITQLNLQLPFLVGDSTKLPTTVGQKGLFGGAVTASTEVYVLPKGNAFEPVRAVTVRVTGSGGSVSTPAKLLAGVGVSLHALSPEAADAFGKDALPRLSAITQARTVITVGKFYDLTVVVLGPSTLAFVFTPSGVPAPVDSENLGK